MQIRKHIIRSLLSGLPIFPGYAYASADHTYSTNSGAADTSSTMGYNDSLSTPIDSNYGGFHFAANTAYSLMAVTSLSEGQTLNIVPTTGRDTVVYNNNTDVSSTLPLYKDGEIFWPTSGPDLNVSPTAASVFGYILSSGSTVNIGIGATEDGHMIASTLITNAKIFLENINIGFQFSQYAAQNIDTLKLDQPTVIAIAKGQALSSTVDTASHGGFFIMNADKALDYYNKNYANIYNNPETNLHTLGTDKTITKNDLLSFNMGVGSVPFGNIFIPVVAALTQTATQLTHASSSSEIASAIHSTTSLSVFLDPIYSISSDDTMLEVAFTRNKTNFNSVGETHNEISTGTALNTVSQDSAVYKAFSINTDRNQARQELNNLSGEIHSSVRTGLIQDSFMLSNAVMNRLDNADCDFGRRGQSVFDLQTGKKNAACESGHTVLWGQAYGSIGHNSGDGNAAGMSHNTAGFIMGMDTTIRNTNWRAGGFAAYGHSMFNIGSGRSSSANSSNISIGGYAGTHWGRLNLRMGGSYSWNVINTRRQITVTGVGGRATSSYLGGTAQGFAELGYKMHLGRTTFEPFANVTYVNMQTNSYRERGTAAALRGRGEDNGVTFSSFGFRAATRFSIGKAVFMPHLTGAYRHAFGYTGSKIHQSFVAGSQDMGINGVFLSSNAAIIDTGITARLTNRIDFDVSYIGQYGNRSVDSGATGTFKLRF